MNRFLALPLLLLSPALLGAESFQVAAREHLGGIWVPDQGVLWDTSVKSGERPRAPLTPAYAARYQEAIDAAARGKPKADRTTSCLPPGVPRIMAAPFPFEIVLSAQTLYILSEYMSQVRRIHLDGSGPARSGEPSFNGHSTGTWQADALYIETVDLAGESVLDTTGLPYSDALQVQERVRLLAPDKLEIAITLTDPKAFTTPWTVTRTYTKKPGERILEYVCAENNRNPPDSEGNTGFVGVP
jgi:hypothetical protein